MARKCCFECAPDSSSVCSGKFRLFPTHVANLSSVYVGFANHHLFFAAPPPPQAKYPDLAKELKRRMSGELPEGWKDNLPKFVPEVQHVFFRLRRGRVCVL